MGFRYFSCCAALEQQDRLDREAHRIVRKPKRTPLFCAAAEDPRRYTAGEVLARVRSRIDGSGKV